MNKELLLKTFRNTSAAALYIFAVSQLMQNGSKLFGENDTMFTPFLILLLFTLSAAVLGSLVFGQSAILFLDNKKKEGITTAIYSIGWLSIYTLLGIIILILTK